MALKAFYDATVELGVPEQRDDVHRLRLRPHADLQRQGLRPRLGRAPPRHGRRGQGREDLRHVPQHAARHRQPARRGPGTADPGLLGRPVRGDDGEVDGREQRRTSAPCSRTSRTSARPILASWPDRSAGDDRCFATCLASVAACLRLAGRPRRQPASPPPPRSTTRACGGTPAESGWGINFAHQGDIVFATWFTYDTAGKPWWLIAELHKTARRRLLGRRVDGRRPGVQLVALGRHEDRRDQGRHDDGDVHLRHRRQPRVHGQRHLADQGDHQAAVRPRPDLRLGRAGRTSRSRPTTRTCGGTRPSRAGASTSRHQGD